jgi:hypothetical protein
MLCIHVVAGQVGSRSGYGSHPSNTVLVAVDIWIPVIATTPCRTVCPELISGWLPLHWIRGCVQVSAGRTGSRSGHDRCPGITVSVAMDIWTLVIVITSRGAVCHALAADWSPLHGIGVVR